MREVTIENWDGGITLTQQFFEDWYEIIDHALDENRTEAAGGLERYFGIMNGVLNFRNPVTGVCAVDYMASRLLHENCHETWKTMVEMVRGDGWPEGAGSVRSMYESIEADIGDRVVTNEVEHHVSGAYIDVGAFVEGVPECFLDFRDVERTGAGKVVTIAVNIGVAYDVKSTQILRRGAAIIAVIDLLERSGYRVEVLIVTPTHEDRVNGEHLHEIIFPLKKPSEVIAIDRFAFVLCNDMMCRRVMSSLLEQLPPQRRHVLGVRRNGPYGCTFSMSMEGYGADIVIEGGYDFISDASAKKWVVSVLKDQGVALEETAMTGV